MPFHHDWFSIKYNCGFLDINIHIFKQILFLWSYYFEMEKYYHANFLRGRIQLKNKSLKSFAESDISFWIA